MRRVARLRFRQTTLQLTGMLAFLAGIGLAHQGRGVNVAWCWLGLLLVVLNLRRRTMVALLCVCLLGLSLGWWRGTIFMHKLAAYQPLYGQQVTFTVQARDDAVYGSSSQLSFDADHLRDVGLPLAGKLEVSGFGLNAVFQGDLLQVSGKLYSGLGQYQGRISFAHIQLIKRQPSLVANLRRRFTAGMQTALPEPLAPFAMGLLIGQRATLPANTKQDLLMVGLTHIIAVSGYNLTIMLHASRGLLAKRSKRLSTLLAFGLIGLFLLFAGASASIVRAAVVSVFSIATTYYGRSFRPLNLIALAAVLTAWANPFYVWSDTSWYLSFLAFFGVLVIAPLLQLRWPGGWRDSLIIGVALESICAEIMTLPFILHTFGQMSFIGLPANVLITTLVPLAMLFSLVAGLAGMLCAAAAGWLTWPAQLLLTYMLDVAHILSSLPHIFVQNLGLSTAEMIGYYVIIIAVTGLLWYKTRDVRYAKITDEILTPSGRATVARR